MNRTVFTQDPILVGRGLAGDAARPAAAQATAPWVVPTVLVACLALGVASALTLPSLPRYDGFSWLVWGREIAREITGSHQPFRLGGDTSWKPLPVLFTTVFGFFGASMTLWVACARTLGLVGLFIAYRVGHRLGGSRDWPLAGPIAGGLAAVLVVMTSDWTQFMFRATSEPIVITATLLWIDWSLTGRRRAAFTAGVAFCLMRPEASLFLILYAVVWLWRRPSVTLALGLTVGLLLVPVAWLVPPGLAGGHFWQASQDAQNYAAIGHPHPSLHLFLSVWRAAASLTQWPVLAAAGVFTLLAIRVRAWLIVGLAGAGVSYVVIVAVMTLAGYPGLARFMLPAAAVACVLAAVALVQLATLLQDRLLSVGLVVLVVAATIPSFRPAVAAARMQRGVTQDQVVLYRDLAASVRRTGGASRILPCVHSAANVEQQFQPALAWLLGAPVAQIGGAGRTGGVGLGYPRVSFLWMPPGDAPGQIPVGPSRLLPGGLNARKLSDAGIWTVYRLTKPGDPRADACVGH